MSIASSQISSEVPRKFISVITGDGSSLVFTLNHNLNSNDIIVSAREISDDLREVFLDNYPDPSDPLNSLKISFDFAPSALQSYRVIIVG